MFVDFFYKMRAAGIQVSPTAFLTLHRALAMGLINSIDDFYTSARSILVKSERHFDLYDRVFAHHFEGAELPEPEAFEIDELARAMLESWLQNPRELSRLLGMDEKALQKLTPEELIEYFKQRLEEQDKAHHGGGKWIGTGGHSPVGHSGYHPGGMRVGGISRNKSAVKVAMDRRYKDYSKGGLLNHALVGEALKRLRNMVPAGPKDRVNIEESIYQTTRNGGEIEIVFERSLKDKLKVILAIDNGGWSMDPFIPVVQTIFDYARAQFKELKTYFFHNTIYGTLWEDPARFRKPVPLDEVLRLDPQTRLVIVGDASMAPYELMATDGSIHLEERSGKRSLDCLLQLADAFPRSVWLNPKQAGSWPYTRTVMAIREIFPMFELTIDGLEAAVDRLMSRAS